MVKLSIDGCSVEVIEGTTVLEAARLAGISIPTLCELKDLNLIASCRVCIVEIEGNGALCAACNTVVNEGMTVRTNTPRVVAARRGNVEAILSQHRSACTSCVRVKTCALRKLAEDLAVGESVVSMPAKGAWDASFPLQRDESKCIKCMRCVAICEKVQHCAVWDRAGVGPSTGVVVKYGLGIDEAGCALCGQCITHCPTGALTARDDIGYVLDAILDPEVMTVVQVAPAVRASWGEDVGVSRENATPGRLASALRALGFDRVFDTDFAADLTIMEEGSEFLEFIGSDKPRPMLTSCCPSWVRFAKLHFPNYVDRLSSAKSPHQMLGALVKNTMREEAEASGKKKLFVVSIMPCVAKKYEADVPELSTEGGADVDAVLTVREFDRMLHLFGVDCAALEETAFDNPLGLSTGAGTIFGRTGGVMEAALRTAATILTGEPASLEACSCISATPETPWMAKELDVAGTKVRIAVASGLANTAKLLNALDAGEVEFDFVEIMACPGGCVNGGGQPIRFNTEQAAERAQVLDTLDAAETLRMSHDNPDIPKLYDEVLEKPLSHRSHEWLHTDQETWNI
ncbi:MAG: [Eggerthellaceae bacterium]|nr:[FeFe] hydrogenase, group A [Eggerthellaceae bacterium]